MNELTKDQKAFQPDWFGLKTYAEVAEHVADNLSSIVAMLHKRFVLTQSYNDLWLPGSNGIVVALVYDNEGWAYTVEMDNAIRSPDFSVDFEPWPNISIDDFFRCTIRLEACNDK